MTWSLHNQHDYRIQMSPKRVAHKGTIMLDRSSHNEGGDPEAYNREIMTITHFTRNRILGRPTLCTWNSKINRYPYRAQGPQLYPLLNLGRKRIRSSFNLAGNGGCGLTSNQIRTLQRCTFAILIWSCVYSVLQDLDRIMEDAQNSESTDGSFAPGGRSLPPAGTRY